MSEEENLVKEIKTSIKNYGKNMVIILSVLV